MYRAGAASNEDHPRKRNDDENESGEILLGGAEAVAQLRLTPASVAGSAFFDEWSALAAALVVLLANAAADSVRAATFALSPSTSTSASAAAAALWEGTFYSSLWAVLTALYTLIKVEVDQARVLSSWEHLKEAAVVAAGASGAALLLLLSPLSDSSSPRASSSSSSPSLLLPPLDLAAGGRAAARLLYVATEIEVETFPKFLVALPLAAVAGMLVPLLAGSAARAARAVSLSAARTPRWGRDLLVAGSRRDRAALRCAALVAPLAAALLWLRPCARLWIPPGGAGGGADAAAAAVDALRSLSLLFAALASVLAARPSVEAHCGTALVVWWTRKHGFVCRRSGKKSGSGGGGSGGGGTDGGGGEVATASAAAVAAAAAAAAAARRRAGEVLRLSMQFINLFALKAGVQALAPALLWLGCGAASLAQAAAGPTAPEGGGGGSGSGGHVALWLGGWSSAAFSLCSLWHLTLYWCGWLTDVPSGGKR